MVGYNSTQDALTLGDTDSLNVGDYELSYDASTNEWQAEYGPSGDTTSIPTNVSGSLHPTDFADALAGKALADNGTLYNSVQSAVDNATGFVFVGPSTFNESVTISIEGLMLMGSGEDTLIDGGTIGDAVTVQASEVVMRNFSAQTANGSGVAIQSQSPQCLAEKIVVKQSAGDAIQSASDETSVISCRTEPGVSGRGIDMDGQRCLISDNICDSPSSDGMKVRSDSVIVDNIISNSGRIGIQGIADDYLIGGNRIIGAAQDGILVDGTDNIIFNNRVSDSSNFDIDDNGTNTLLDGNKTGPSN
jgi:hypothetical protein